MEYKQIEGYENYYVCNSGVNEQTVLSTKKRMIRWLEIDDKDGHLSVTLYNKGKRVYKGIHYLLAQAFIPIPEKYKDVPKEKLVVHHIDINPRNNNLSNLQWLTDEEHGRLHNKGEKHPMYGTHHSEEHRKKISEANKGRVFSEETRKKIGDAQRGEKSHMYGKHLSLETKRKMSESRKGKTLSEETRQKMSERQKGEKGYWYGKQRSEDTRMKMSDSHHKKMVAQYTDEGELIHIYPSVSKASKETGINSGSISSCCLGKVKHAGGYKWRYVD